MVGIEDIEEAQNMIRELRDSDNHLCPANEHEGEFCSCGDYDRVIDFLEFLKSKI